MSKTFYLLEQAALEALCLLACRKIPTTEDSDGDDDLGSHSEKDRFFSNMEGSTTTVQLVQQGWCIDVPLTSAKQQKVFDTELSLARTECTFRHPTETARTRYVLYERALSMVHNNIQEHENRWNNDLVIQVRKFIRSSLDMFEANEIVTPVAFISSGLSTGENSSAFKEVETEIRNTVPFLARISAGKCPNVKLAFQNICKQLLHNNLNVSQFLDMTTADDFTDDEDDDTLMDTSMKTSYRKSKTRYFSVHDLQKWYESKCPAYFENPLFKNSPSLGMINIRRREELKRTANAVDSTTPLKPTSETPMRNRRQSSENSTPKKARVSIVSKNLSIQLIDITEESEDVQPPKRELRSSPQKKTPPQRLSRTSVKMTTSTPKSILKPSTTNSEPCSITPVIASPRTPRRVNYNANTPSTPQNSQLRTFTAMSAKGSGASGSGLGAKFSSRRLSIVQKHKLIAILVENADCFAPNVIPELLKLLSCSKLPVLFIFGVGHCLGDLGRFIPVNCSAAFTYKVFETISSAQMLNQLFKKIQNDDRIPMKLGPKALQYLTNFLMSQHFSLKRLLQAYQICLLSHYRLPHSVFCNGSSEFENDAADALIQASLKHISEASVKIQKSRILEARIKMQEWMLILNLLFVIKNTLNPGVENFREFCISCESGKLLEVIEGSNECPLDRTLTELRNLKNQSLLSLMEKVCHKFCGTVKKFRAFTFRPYVTHCKDESTTRSCAADVVSDLEEFMEKCRSLNKQKETKSPINHSVELQKAIKKNKSISRDQLQETLRKGIESKHGSKEYLELRKEFVSFVEKVVRKYLKPFSSMDNYSKIFIFDDVEHIKHAFSPCIDGTIVQSLSKPAIYLKCSCCKDLDVYANSDTLPDTCIVFKLLKEQMFKKIDLNVIYEAFLTYVEYPVIKKKQKENQMDNYLLRFRQAVAELQHNKILKRSKNKPDEITKLYWH